MNRFSAPSLGLAAGLALYAGAPRPCHAQAASEGILQGMVIAGAASHHGVPATPSRLVPGLRVQSPVDAWAEIALSDGTSIVLDPGADLTMQSVSRVGRTGRWVVKGISGGGRLRVSAADGMQVQIQIPQALITIVASTAVIDSGVPGSVLLLSGGEAHVRAASGEETLLRRPGFAVRLDDGGPRREDPRQLAAAVDSFAPVAGAARGAQAGTGLGAGNPWLAASRPAVGGQYGEAVGRSQDAATPSPALASQPAAGESGGPAQFASISATSGPGGQPAAVDQDGTSQVSVPVGVPSSPSQSGPLSQFNPENSAGGASFTLVSDVLPAGVAQAGVGTTSGHIALRKITIGSLLFSGDLPLSALSPLPIGQLGGPGDESTLVFLGKGFWPTTAWPSGAPIETRAQGDTGLLVKVNRQGMPALHVDIQVAPSGQSSASVFVGAFNSTPLNMTGTTVGSASIAGDPGPSRYQFRANIGDGPPGYGTGAYNVNSSQNPQFPFNLVFGLFSAAKIYIPGQDTASVVQQTDAGLTFDPTSTRKHLYLAPNPGVNISGFASAVVQRTGTGTGVLYAGTGTATFASPPGNPGAFDGTVALAPTGVGSQPTNNPQLPAPNGVTSVPLLQFGGVQADGKTPATVVIRPATFAGIGNSTAITSVDDNMAPGLPGQNLPPSNEHLAWGVFMGDLANRVAPSGPGDYVGMGFWVAGVPVPPGSMPATGAATYSGGLIGTAVAAQGGSPPSVRTVIGRFTDTWNFGLRSGTMNAAFDNQAWTGLKTTMPQGAGTFTGAGVSTTGQALMSVNGAFFHNPATGGSLSPANLPIGIGGTFGIHNTLGSYGANGIFVGKRP